MPPDQVPKCPIAPTISTTPSGSFGGSLGGRGSECVYHDDEDEDLNQQRAGLDETVEEGDTTEVPFIGVRNFLSAGTKRPGTVGQW